ncbi:acid-sensing ion channel 4-B-like [Amblyomma americanum]
MVHDLGAVVADYLRFEDIVTLSVYEPAWATFPAVTVCNLNRVRKSALCNRDLPPTKGPNAAIFRWRRILCNTTDRDVAIRKEDLNLQRELTDWIRVVFRDARYAEYELGHQMDDMVQRCVINGQDCRDKNVLGVKLVPAYGDCVCVGCYPNDGKGDVEETTAGCKHELNLILNVELDEYLPLSVEAGFAVMVHNPRSEINVALDTSYVAAGFSTHIAVSRSEFRRLGPPFQNPCRSQWPPEISSYVDSEKHYNAYECRDYCYQARLFEACGCVSSQYMRPNWGVINAAPICPSGGSAGPALCAKAMEVKIGRGGVSCDCSQPCLDIAFETTQSALALRGNTMTNSSRYTTNRLQAEVTVYQVSPQTRVQARIPRVKFATVLSRAGGLMGMYLGASMVVLLSLADALTSALLQWASANGFNIGHRR